MGGGCVCVVWILCVVVQTAGNQGDQREQRDVTSDGAHVGRPLRHGEERPEWLSLKDTFETDDHGRVQMGVSNPDCDDAQTNLTVDWDPADSQAYTCGNGEGQWKMNHHRAELKLALKNKMKDGECNTKSRDNDSVSENEVVHGNETESESEEEEERFDWRNDDPESCFWIKHMIKANADWDCLSQNEIEIPDHICMDESIEYEEVPPRSGSHRPLWPVYGEYQYCPPQRWLHSLEHGAVVMLYDPCVLEDPELSLELETLNRTVRDCVRRHVITPYKGMDQPFALLTYGCRLLMSRVDEDLASFFIVQNAKRGPEHLADDGQYDVGLLRNADIIYKSGVLDDCLCPKWHNPLLPIPTDSFCPN